MFNKNIRGEGGFEVYKNDHIYFPKVFGFVHEENIS